MTAASLRLGISDTLYRRRGLLVLLLLVPPMLWVGAVYVGSLIALLANSVPVSHGGVVAHV